MTAVELVAHAIQSFLHTPPDGALGLAQLSRDFRRRQTLVEAHHQGLPEGFHQARHCLGNLAVDLRIADQVLGRGNAAVVQSVRGRGSLDDVIIGVSPYIVTLFVMLALLVAFPGIAMWLPRQLG